ncbi:MAG: fused MFS/spermidine synthase [Planctomycetota bacterium]
MTTLRRALLVFLNGFAILGVEFVAQRQLAPVFGQSVHVWSAVIGVLLLALAVGYALGGRWGSRARSERALAGAHAAAALWLVGVALFGPDIAAALGPRGGLDPSAWPLGRFGVVGACLVLHALPCALLAMTTPFVVARAASSGRAGGATGRFVALGTLGSLLACWVVPLEWIPTFGTRGSWWVVIGLVGLDAALAAAARARGTPTGHEAAPAAAPASGQLRRGPALGTALVTGLAITVLEVGGVRLMSPWVGQSNHVWAAVIATCLLALALGSALGGRWSSRADPRGALVTLLALGVPAAALPAALATPWMSHLVPDGLQSLVVLPVAFAGSIGGALLLLAPGLVALGAALPLLAAARGQRDVGRLLAANTVGGLLGCVLTAPLLVPTLGSRETFLLMAGLLLLAAVLLATRPWPWARLVVAVVGLVVPGAYVVVRGGPLRLQPGQLVEVETPYQTVRVVEAPMDAIDPASGSPASWKSRLTVPTRFLRHDEDAETYQSALLEARGDTVLTGGRYFESMAVGAHFVPKPADGVIDVLLIGHAGGTVWRTLRATAPAGVPVRCLAVEIDPGVVDVARGYLAHDELEDERLELVTNEDGRTIVNALPAERRFDLVLVDAYARTNYVPFQVATREFFERVRDHLEPGGWVGVNVLGQGAESRVAAAIATTLGSVFGATWLVPNPYFAGNVILWSSPGAVGGPRVGAHAPPPPALGEAVFAVERLATRFVPSPRDPVLTDDLSPTDKLADEEFGL